MQLGPDIGAAEGHIEVQSGAEITVGEIKEFPLQDKVSVLPTKKGKKMKSLPTEPLFFNPLQETNIFFWPKDDPFGEDHLTRGGGGVTGKFGRERLFISITRARLENLFPGKTKTIFIFIRNKFLKRQKW